MALYENLNSQNILPIINSIIIISLLFFSLFKKGCSRYLIFLIRTILFCLLYISFFSWLIGTNLLVYFSNIFFTQQIAISILPVSLYLYSLESYEGIGFRKKQLLFFIPTLFFIIDRIPFYIKTTIEKKEFLNFQIDGYKNIIKETGWLFTHTFHEILTICTSILIAILIIKKAVKKSSLNTNNSLNLLYLKNFIFTIWGGLLLAFIVIYALSLFIPDDLYFIIQLYLTSITLISIFFTIKFDRNLTNSKVKAKNYKQKTTIPTQPKKEVNSNTIIPASTKATLNLGKVYDKNDTRKISDQEKNYLEIEDTVMNLFRITKCYTKQGYTIVLLSKDTKLPVYMLSRWLNKYKNIKFNDFINNLRIEEMIRRIEDEKLLDKFTLSAISATVGFSNRTTFTTSFKKYTGKTPSDYYNITNKDYLATVDY